MTNREFITIPSIFILTLVLSCSRPHRSTVFESSPITLGELSGHPDVSILEKDGTMLYIVSETHAPEGKENSLTQRIQAYVTNHPNSAIGKEGYDAGGQLEAIERTASQLDEQMFGLEDLKVRTLLDLIIAIQWFLRADSLLTYKKQVTESDTTWPKAYEDALQTSLDSWASNHRELFFRIWQQKSIKNLILKWIKENETNPIALGHKHYLLHDTYFAALQDDLIVLDGDEIVQIEDDSHRSGMQDFYLAILDIVRDNKEIPPDFSEFFARFTKNPSIAYDEVGVDGRNKTFNESLEAYISHYKPTIVFMIIGKNHRIGVVHNLIKQHSWKHVRSDLTGLHKSLLGRIAEEEKDRSDLEPQADAAAIEKIDSLLDFTRNQVRLFHELSDQPGFKF